MVVPPTKDDAVADETWVPRAWFGGALRAALPSSWLDASDARPVPDHQEMWHQGGGEGAASSALLVEIVEHDAAVADGAAGRHFFADAAEGAGAGAGADGSAGGDAFQGGEVDAGSLAAPGMPGGRPTAAYEGEFAVAAGAGGAPGQGAEGAVVVAAALAVFRVPRVGSDIVITSFEPAGGAPEGGPEAEAATTAASATGAAAAGRAAGGPLAAARGRLARVLATMSVQDWGLFGSGGEG